MRTAFSTSPSIIDVFPQHNDVMENGGAIPAMAYARQAPSAPSNPQNTVDGSLVARPGRRRSAMAIVAVAVPAMITGGGLTIAADGIRRRVQSGGFALETGLSSSESNAPATLDPTDHRSRAALPEIIVGASLAALGAGLTCTAGCFLL